MRVAGAWTGRELVVFGRGTTREPWRRNIAAAYDPLTRRWRKLAPPAGQPGSLEGRYDAVWTGHEVVVWGPDTVLAYSPDRNRWRRLPKPPTGHGFAVWTGREVIGWGGGCCGDANADGSAYDPARNRWRRLPRAPLPPGQQPTGVWTGKELLVFGVRRPDGPPLRAAAAYDPARNRWRRIAPIPAPRYGAVAVWDGREALVAGGTSGATLPHTGFAYAPATNRWRALPPMETPRFGAAGVWTGRELLLWGGASGSKAGEVPPHGLAYDPRKNRWSSLPQAPLVGRSYPVGAWTGRSFLVWGGSAGVCAPDGVHGCRTKVFADGAGFTPAPR